MKRELTFLPLLILFPGIVLANPLVSPTHIAGFIVVVGTSFLLEITITTGYLTLVGMRAGIVFPTLFLINIGTYVGILLPAFDTGLHFAIIEGLVVITEGVVLKIMGCFPFFQRETFTTLKWRHAFGAAALGNAVSYGVGQMIS